MEYESAPVRSAHLRLGFETAAFAKAVAQEVATPGIAPVAAAERFLSESFAACMHEFLGRRLIKLPTIKTWLRGAGAFSTLFQLGKDGFDIWYPEVWFSTKHADAIDTISVQPVGYSLEDIDYGSGVSKKFFFKTKTLKTQVNHELRLLKVHLPRELWSTTIAAVNSYAALTQPYIANPNPFARGKDKGSDIGLTGYRTVSFDHLIDGSRLFCGCARLTHEKMRKSAADIGGSYQPDSWPQRMVELFDHAEYREAICHLCVSYAFGPEAAALRYGDNMQEFEEPYIDQFTVGFGMDSRTARAEVQQKLGLSRWKNEAALYNIVKELFKDDTIQREASPVWLGRQRLDIFLPDYKLAIEYQGAQHFQAVGLFGGEEGLLRAAERDALKKGLCEQNGVTLLYVLHSDPLTPASLKRRLQRFMRPTNG